MVADRRFHLAWFLTFVADSWNGPWGYGGMPWNGDFHVEVAKALERACFDYVIIEDKLMVSDVYGGSMQHDLKHGIAPKHDPIPLATLMAYNTSRLGVVATMSTSFYPPFMLARLSSTVDHIARGRFGWNIVTSAEDQAAQNFGHDTIAEHGLRYDMADEYVDVVTRLWDSWEPDAVVRDHRTGTYVDHTKVHRVDFRGRFYSSRGPLNTVRPPRGRPVLCQAGASPRGRDFAAKYADTIIAMGTNPVEMKAYRDDVRERALAHGRKPDDCKVLYVVSPVVDETEEAARAKVQRWITDPNYIEYVLTYISAITEVDFSRFDLDEPLPDDLTTNGERGTLEAFMQRGSGKKLRELVGLGLFHGVDLVGTPDSVADRMGELMDEVGGDGFLVASPTFHLDRRYLAEITDGLVPALQRRGLTRTGYGSEYFRDNLLEF